MRSPFSIFRRQEKKLLAVLAIMAMFAFTFVGFAGMSVQALVELVGGRAAGPGGELIAETNWGGITLAELDEHQRRRLVANRFLELAQERAGNRFGANRQFFGPATPEDVVNALLIRRDAEQAGMRISDDAVARFVDNVTRDPRNNDVKLTTDMFEDICRNLLHIPGPALFDILRDELMVSEMVQVVGGSEVIVGGVALMTPAELWDSYQKLHTKVTLEVAAVPVADFTPQVPDPSDDELRAYFETAKERLPDAASPEAGFKQPRRVQVEYVMANYDRFLEGTEVPEEEVRQYYENNKERYRIFDELPDPSDSPAAGEPTDKPETAAPDDEKPATPDPDSAAPDEKPETNPAEERPRDDAEKKPGSTKEPADEAPKPDSESAPEEDQGGDAPTASDATDDGGNQDSIDELTEPAADETAAAPPDQPAKEAPAPAEPPATTPDPPTPAQSPEAPDASAKTPAAQPTDQVPAEDKPEAATDQPADEKAQQGPEETEKTPEPRYQPLDDLLALKIRDEVLRQKTLQRIEQVLDSVSYSKFEDYERRRAEWTTAQEEQKADPTVEVPEEPVRPDLAAVATQYGLEYAIPPLVSREEAGKLEGIGAAMDFRDTTGQGRSFVDNAFAEAPLFEPHMVRDPQNNGYLYWRVEDKPEHVPQFDAVRQQVLESWKLNEARKLAEPRARELAQKARDAATPLDQSLAGDPAIIVQTTPAFSWLTRPPALGPNAFVEPPPEPSEVEFVDLPGEDFYETAFGLTAGEIAVAPNSPHTVWYVVRAVSREEASREQFPRESFFGQVLFGIPLLSAYDYLAAQGRQEVMQKWLADLQNSNGLKWVRDPDNPAEPMAPRS